MNGLRMKDQRIAEIIVRSVATGKLVSGAVMLAQRLVERWDAGPAPRAAAPEKAPIASVEHHAKARRQEEHQREEVKEEVWRLCLQRVLIDHRGRLACECCRRERALEPHHLVLRAREDKVQSVMALCADCHRLAPSSAHRRVMWFAKEIVIPWAKAHSYPLPPKRNTDDPEHPHRPRL